MLLPVKLVHSLPGNVFQKTVRNFENDQKNINYFGCTPLFLLFRRNRRNNNFLTFFYN